MYLDIYKFYISALKSTLSTSNAFSKYSSKTFWEEWTVGKFNMEKQHDASGNERSLSPSKYLTLIDRDIPHGGKYSKPVTNLKSSWVFSVDAFTKKLSKNLLLCIFSKSVSSFPSFVTKLMNWSYVITKSLETKTSRQIFGWSTIKDQKPEICKPSRIILIWAILFRTSSSYRISVPRYAFLEIFIVFVGSNWEQLISCMFLSTTSSSSSWVLTSSSLFKNSITPLDPACSGILLFLRNG